MGKGLNYLKMYGYGLLEQGVFEQDFYSDNDEDDSSEEFYFQFFYFTETKTAADSGHGKQECGEGNDHDGKTDICFQECKTDTYGQGIDTGGYAESK